MRRIRSTLERLPEVHRPEAIAPRQSESDWSFDPPRHKMTTDNGQYTKAFTQFQQGMPQNV
jgi:hypothetical protein